jgi:predicted anti-sigma-YlaC factor YlaD
MGKQRKHSWVKKNIIRYIDGDLAENEKIDYINHLESCKSCFEAYKTIETVLKDSYIKQEAPNYLWDRVSSSINNSNTRKIPDNLLVAKYKLLYAAIIVIIVLSTFVGNAFVFSNEKNSSCDIIESIFPIYANDFNISIELSLLNGVDNEK